MKISHSEAIRLIRQHGVEDGNEERLYDPTNQVYVGGSFYEDMGRKSEYSKRAVLEWLGY